jgi:hypothetical protein
MDTVTRLVIVRRSSDDVQNRALIVRLDGEEVATLMYGQEITREIPLGRHVLLADNTWEKKSIEFEAEAGIEARFFVTNKAGRLTNFLVALIGSGPLYVEIRRDEP